MNLVDTNIIIDLLRADSEWRAWSEAQLLAARHTGGLVINPVIYAELSAMPQTLDMLDGFLDAVGMAIAPLPKLSARLAGQAFWAYRQRKGVKTGVLPDFFIGAHAQAEGWTLLTRDATRYRTYFPAVKLVSPAG